MAVLGPLATGDSAVDNALARRSYLALADAARVTGLAGEARRAERMAMNLPPDTGGALANLPPMEIYLIRVQGKNMSLRRMQLSLARAFTGFYMPLSDALEAWVARAASGTMESQGPDESTGQIRQIILNQVGPVLPETAEALLDMLPDLARYYMSNHELLTPGETGVNRKALRNWLIGTMVFVLVITIISIVPGLIGALVAFLAVIVGIVASFFGASVPH